MDRIDLNNLDKSTWTTYRFDQIASSISERVDPTNTDLKHYIGLEHIDSENIHITRMGAPTEVSGQKLRCYPGDVIFGRRRAYQRKAAVCEVDGFCSAHSLVLRANPEIIDPKLFPFFLHSDTFMHRAVDISVGSLSPTINWGALKKQEFLLPPKEQQVQLVGILWGMDEVVAKDRQLLNSITKANSIVITNEIKNLQTNYENTALCELVELRTGKLDSNAAIENGKFHFFTCAPETLRIDTYSFDCEAILLAGNNAAGVYPLKHYKGKFDAYQRTYVITIKDDVGLNYRYLLEVIRSQLGLLQRHSVGSSTKFLTMGVLKKMKIPVPTETDQKIMVKKVEAFSNSISKTNTALSAGISMQKSLINQVF
ncbi:MAG: restriction endonuclease subunit S [Desulfuromonadaceae bacterium]|nr:restriction endonuclease subunit S [Desulfuromonadaceae bacterium]